MLAPHRSGLQIPLALLANRGGFGFGRMSFAPHTYDPVAFTGDTPAISGYSLCPNHPAARRISVWEALGRPAVQAHDYPS